MRYDAPPWQLFEDLVRRILESNNFNVQVNSPRGDAGFDFRALIATEIWAIEVKYYRTARAQPRLIESAAMRLIRNGINAQAKKGMLVVSCLLSDVLRDELEKKFSITFVDRTDLRRQASVRPELAEELDALLEDSSVLQQQNVPSFRGDLAQSRPLEESETLTVDTRGTDLCQRLRQIGRGKKGWADYEKICGEILSYLFPNDLYGWHSQQRTDDGLNRFDLVCRVRPTTEFWRFLIDHLDSRYALFEFKNYAGKIRQGQILTTEKYLLERGLRRVAIILTRAGADKAAVLMTQGAMREHGKLMLIVNDEKICEMLHMKERGDDPSDCLFELADKFLLSLPR